MISVVVSVYNTGKYLPKAMEALLAQTYRDYEILIVDDGSTDAASAAECDIQAQGRENVRVFHKPNGGVSSARNFGIEHARGEYVIFPDPDDWVEPNYLERLLSLREETGADLTVCGHYVNTGGADSLWEPGAVKTVLDMDRAFALLMRPDSYCGYAWNKLYRMDLIRENGLRFDTELGMIQDLHFAVRYFMHCKTVAYDPAPLYHYSRDNGGVTLFQKKLGKRELSGLLAYEKIGEMTRGSYPAVESAAYASLCERCLRFIGVYVRTGMDEPETLAVLQKTFHKYRRHFYKCPDFTFRHKCAAATTACSPFLYHYLVRTFGHMRRGRQ